MRFAIALSLFCPLAAAAEPPAGRPPVVMEKLDVTGYCPIEKVGSYRMPAGRKGAAVVADGDHLYIVGGQDAGNSYLDTILRFNVTTGKSEPFLRLKEARIFHSAVRIGRQMYVLGGRATPETVDGIPSSFSESRNRRPREVTRTTSLAFLGLALASVEIIDLDSREHRYGRSMPVPKSYFGAAVYDGRLWVIGGSKWVGGVSAFTNSVEIYDPRSDRWTKGVPMPTPRQCPAVVTGDLILVPGGYNGTSKLAAFEFFSPKETAWKKLPDLPVRISATALALLDKYLIFFGDYDRSDEVFVYDLSKRQGDTFTLGYTAGHHAACMVHRERIYVVGGATTPVGTASDEIQIFALRVRRGSSAQTK